jgi:hypothetical protein
MRALLRHVPTGLYVQSAEQWTGDAEQAFDFKTMGQAIRFVEKAGLSRHAAARFRASLDANHRNLARNARAFGLNARREYGGDSLGVPVWVDAALASRVKRTNLGL